MNEQVKGRLSVLFPKANLSKTRMEQYTNKIATKLTEESTEEEIDDIIKDYNEIVNFEQVAKDDDRIRTLESKPKPQESEKMKEEPIKNDNEILLDAISKLTEKVTVFETQKQAETIATKFANDERLRGIPKLMIERNTPTTMEDIDAYADILANDWKEIQTQAKLSQFGVDSTPQGKTNSSTSAKEATDEEVDSIFNNMTI